jgi:hypothetical protein
MSKLRPPGKPRMKGGHGGKRPGAGNKHGSKVRRWRKDALESSEKLGTRPVDVLLAGQDYFYSRYLDAVSNGTQAEAAKALKEAIAAAEAAAPYIHPRLQAVAMKTETINPLIELLRFIDGKSRGLNGHASTPLIETTASIQNGRAAPLIEADDEN